MDMSEVSVHRRTGQFFLGGAEPSLPEIFLQRPKNYYGNLQNYFARLDSPHPIVISKNSGFPALYLTRQNEFRFFSVNECKNIFFKILAATFCPKNLPFARK